MRLLDFYYCTTNDSSSELPQMYYSKYQYDKYCDCTIPLKLLSVSSEEVRIPTLWQMQVIAKMHGVNILSYDDNTNYELYGEMQHSSNMSEEELDANYYRPDTLDDYFENLAGIASWYGCETMELKCLAKSLFKKYLYVEKICNLPFAEFQSLYCRLIKAGYSKCAEWLLKNHYNKVNALLLYNDDNSLIIETDTHSNDTLKTGNNIVNHVLEKYLNTEILPKYEGYAEEHNSNHIQEVARRCIELATKENLKGAETVDIDMITTAAYFHGLTTPAEGKEGLCYAVKVLREDEFINNIFTSEQVKCITEAIQENKYPTLEGNKSAFLKILNAADNIINMHSIIKQACKDSLKLNPNFTVNAHIESVCNQLAEDCSKNKYVRDSELITEFDKCHLIELEYYLQDGNELKNYCERLLNSFNLHRLY